MKVGPRRPLAPDADVIRALAGLLSETGLSEIEYAVGDHRIRVAKARAGKTVLMNGHVNGGHANGATSQPTIAAEPAEIPAANGHGMRLDDPGLITAPLVGIAYLAAQPGIAPFVRVGDPIEKGQTLLIIEAMKVMNQIRAPRAGRLARILVTDADPVEYGAPLMLIE